MSITLWSFADEFWVVCPRCSARALVRPYSEKRPARLVCVKCGTSRSWVLSARGVLTSGRASQWPRGTYAVGDAADPYFHLPLWLRVPCGSEVLWAFNERHLNFIDEYVRAENRRRAPTLPGGPRNALLESRLPRWMKLARNREAVIAAIAKLRASLT
ncbi:hypothetical protein ACFPN2_19400 [Steroidobacter flavus]|uniref:Uncharacterized protein n=1 Tax=Steroidobacter flavus TaxID=1842136 RepID=A0ABV8SX97_9GAMM